MKKLIFLGGTCAGSTWRDSLIPKLTNEVFNPVVANWTPEDQAKEELAKSRADIRLYVLTPKSNSPYSIAEVVNDSNKVPSRTVFFIKEQDEDLSFTTHELKVLKEIGKMVNSNGGVWAKTEDELVEILNS